MLDGDGLAAFLAIAEQRSFSRAADSMGIVQSVISKRLLRLEDQLGTRLIDRSQKSDIRLTRAGEIFLPEAQAALTQMERAERFGHKLARGLSGPVNIGYIFSAAMSGALTALLTHLRAISADLQLCPRLMETPAQLAGLEAGTLDIGLMRARPSYPADCRAQTIRTEPLLLCVSTRHRLAAEASVAPDALAGERFILPQFHEKVGLIDSLEQLCAAGGFAMPPIIRTDDFVTAAALAAAQEGVVLAPASLAHLNMGGLRFLPFTGFDSPLATVLVHRQDLRHINPGWFDIGTRLD